jgi:hypothetical protein
MLHSVPHKTLKTASKQRFIDGILFEQVMALSENGIKK